MQATSCTERASTGCQIADGPNVVISDSSPARCTGLGPAAAYGAATVVPPLLWQRAPYSATSNRANPEAANTVPATNASTAPAAPSAAAYRAPRPPPAFSLDRAASRSEKHTSEL